MSRTDDPADATIAELLDRIAEARAVLDDVVEPLSPAEREEPLGGGWSAKLHLGHIADWEAGILALLRSESRIDAMGLTKAHWDANDETDVVNTVMADRDQKRALADVLFRYDRVHQDLVEQIATMADSDLQLAYAHFAPDESPANPAPILGWIAGNTFEHYSEHAEWIREGLAAR